MKIEFFRTLNGRSFYARINWMEIDVSLCGGVYKFVRADEKKQFTRKGIRKLLITAFIRSFYMGLGIPEEYYVSFCVRYFKKMRTIQYNMWLIERFLFTVTLVSCYFHFDCCFDIFLRNILSLKCQSMFDGKLVMNIVHYVMWSHPKLIWDRFRLPETLTIIFTPCLFYIYCLSDSDKLILI